MCLMFYFVRMLNRQMRQYCLASRSYEEESVHSGSDEAKAVPLSLQKGLDGSDILAAAFSKTESDKG